MVENHCLESRQIVGLSQGGYLEKDSFVVSKFYGSEKSNTESCFEILDNLPIHILFPSHWSILVCQILPKLDIISFCFAHHHPPHPAPTESVYTLPFSCIPVSETLLNHFAQQLHVWFIFLPGGEHFQGRVWKGRWSVCQTKARANRRVWHQTIIFRQLLKMLLTNRVLGEAVRIKQWCYVRIVGGPQFFHI